MKKLLCLVLALTFVCALAACGGETEDTTPVGEQTTAPVETTTEPVSDTTVDDGKIEYTVKVVDESGNAISAVDKVQVCDETNMCSIIFLTDGAGTIRLVEAEYHATLMGMPEGYEYVGEEQEFSFDTTNTCVITLKAIA